MLRTLLTVLIILALIGGGGFALNEAGIINVSLNSDSTPTPTAEVVAVVTASATTEMPTATVAQGVETAAATETLASTAEPTNAPSEEPTLIPTNAPTLVPTVTTAPTETAPANTPTTAPTQPAATEEPTALPEATIAGAIPTPIAVAAGDATITLRAAVRGEETLLLTSATPAADGTELIVLSLIVVNDGASEISVEAGQFQLDADGVLIPVDVAMSKAIAEVLGTFTAGAEADQITLSPAQEREIVLAFQVETSASELSLVIDGEAGGSIPVTPYVVTLEQFGEIRADAAAGASPVAEGGSAGADLEAAWIRACTDQLKQSEAICSCAWNVLAEDLTAADLEVTVREVEATGKLPSNIGRRLWTDARLVACL